MNGILKLLTRKKGLVAEDFKYIGGLQNKKSEAYPSYAKAIKHLNLKFRNLAEAYNFQGEINVFENDNLLSESGAIAGFSNYGGNGFSGQGNLEGNASLTEEENEIEAEEEVELTEEEKAVDDMMKEDEESEEATEEKESISEHKLSINSAIEKMDAIIDNLTEGKKKVYTLK